MKKDLVCQEAGPSIGHKIFGAVSMFVVWRALCLLRIEVMYFHQGRHLCISGSCQYRKQNPSLF